MNNFSIAGIFATPILTVNIQNRINFLETQELIELENDKENHILNGNGNFYHKDSYILDHMAPSIKNAINEALDYFSTQIMGEEQRQLEITQSWININTPGTSHHKHRHPNSILSGVLFLKTFEKCGDLVFHQPYYHFNNRMIRNKITNQNPWTWDNILYTPKEGELCIFPSELEHSVRINESPISRISLSFNTFYSGKLLYNSNEYELTELNVAVK